MEKLSLTLLGNFEAHLDERPFTQFRTNKVQALLIYLIVEAPTLHQRESLMELLWPGLPLKSAQVNLRQILYQLNKVMPDVEPESAAEPVSLLITDRKTIQLHPHYPASSDVTALTTLLQRSWQHSHRDLLTCADCRTWLEEAVALYQGNFLADFSLYDSNNYEAWAQVKRESLRRQTLDALDTLTQIYLAEQTYQQAEAAARQQLTIDNLRENAYRQLMQILALTGRRSEAVALYDTCRKLLSDELGMAPTAKTTALSEQIKGGSLNLATPVQQGIRGYELGEKLGEGAFGSVYRAVQKGIGREVAIKVIHAKYANQPRFIRRFEAEAQIVARLEYPHIVPLYDYWREADGAYLVMRWLRGGSLQAALNKEPFALDTAVPLINQIAGALHTAHRQGIIHRDVKPANILLDEDGNAYLSDFGIARDSTVNLQLTQAHELLGSPNYISPEQLLGEEVTPATDIYCLGLVLYKVLTGSQPFSTTSMADLIQKQVNEPLPLIGPTRPDLPATIDDIIQQATAKKAADRFDDALLFAEALHQAVSRTNGRSLTPLPPITAVAETDIVNPYKGLHAFQEQDADHFYGRQTLIQQLLAHLDPRSPISLRNRTSDAENRFLALVGPSGSGKSSVVKAGLIPALNKGALPGSEEWFIVDMTPGSYPLEELESALLRVAVNPPPGLLEPLQKDERGLLRTLKRLLPQDKNVDKPSQLLLVIDQFEELFTLVQNEADRTHFLDNLFTALTDAQSRLRVIVTLRADFYDRPLQLPQLGEWLRQRTELVLPLTVAELEQAITAPAASMGVTLESALVSAIITDVNEQPGALPLLQYALTELFERRDGRTLTLATYEEIGGVTGALARRADDIYNRLDAPAQEASRQLFLRLITLGEGIEDTRRRVLLTELESLTDQSSMSLRDASPVNRQSKIVNQYGRYRLLTFDHDPVTRGATVEVAHEALLREWPRLRNWLEESREDVRRQRLLAHAASQWEGANHDNSYLLRGSRLVEFESWDETTTVALTGSEHDFLQNSIAARDQRHAEEEARQQRELETVQQLAEEQTQRAEEQSQAAQSLRQRALFLTGALVIAAILAVSAFSFARSSTNNANLANTREAEAIANANLAATNEAVADEERDVAIRAEETAVAAGILADEQRDAALDAEAEANEARQTAEQQARIAFSRELAAAAIANLDKDPERSVLLALHAVREAYTQEAEEVLHNTVPHLRVLQTLIGHEDWLWDLDYTADGSRLVTSARDQTIRIWDTSNGQELIQWSIDDSETAPDLAFSPDGTYVVTAKEEAIIEVWDANTGELIHTFREHVDAPNVSRPGEPNWINNVDISPDGKTIAAGGSDAVVRLWDASSGIEINAFPIAGENTGSAAYIQFGPDGSWIAAIALGNDDVESEILQIIDIASGSKLLELTETPEDFIDHFTVSPDGSKLLIGDGNEGQAVRLWDIETETELARYPIDANDSLVFSPDGSLFAFGFPGGAKIYETESGQEVLELSGHQGTVIRVKFSPDGNKLATASWDKTARIWDISPSYEIVTLQPFSNVWHTGVSRIAYSPDGSMLAVGGYAGGVSVWDPDSGENMFTLTGPEEFIGGLFFSPDGSRLAAGSDDKTVTVWDTTTGDNLLTLIGHEDWVNNLAYSPNGSTITSVGVGRDLFVWDAITGEIIHELPLASAAWGIAYSPDGSRFAVGENVNTISIWDVTTGEIVQEIENGEGADDVHFSPDGNYLISANYDGTVKIWDLETESLVQEMQAHEGYVVGSAISPNGEIIATGSWDQTARLWDVNSGERLLTLEGDSLGVEDVKFSPDGTHFATASEDGKVRIYTLSLDELVTVAESRLSRSLTEAECQEYLHLEACPTE